MNKELFQYCESVIHGRNRRYRRFEELIEN